MLIPQRFIFFLAAVFTLLALAAASSSVPVEYEERQTSSAPSFRFSVHTHAESAIKYSISPGYVSALICGAGALVAGLMI